MPYGAIPLVASILLGAYFVVLGETSRRSRVAVAAVVFVALLIDRRFPRWSFVATVLQAGVGVYVILYLKAGVGRR